MKPPPPSQPIDPEALRADYRRFLHPDRILLTGHSHQAWPDVAAEGLARAFEDAAQHVDDKWSRAAERADVLRRAVADQLSTPAALVGRRREPSEASSAARREPAGALVARRGASNAGDGDESFGAAGDFPRGLRVTPDQIALGQNTHELVTRFLSALDWRRGRHLVTTDGEFHSMRRQLLRLAEAGAEITFVAADPIDTLQDRLADAVRPDTVGLLASTVLFRTSTIVPPLTDPITAAHRVGAAVLLDAYHAFNVVPQPLDPLGPDPIYVCGGGYKYAQWGEGCCWLRVPPDHDHRPIYTGWFSDFAGLDAAQTTRIGYGHTGADRFAGSTYDPASHYRAAAVAEFFAARRLTIDRLRALSRHQTGRLVDALADLDIASPRDPDRRGGFVALRHPRARDAVPALRARGIYVDARDDLLRLGPAPYVTDAELDAAAAAVREVLTL